MAATNIAVLGSGNVLAELATENDNGEIVPFTGAGATLLTSVVDHTFNVPLSAKHIVQGPSGLIDTLLRKLTLSGLPEVYFRLGYTSGTGAVYFPWEKHLISFYTSELTFPPAGGESQMTLTIESSDPLRKMMTDTRTRAHRGSISQIVENIAIENDLKPVIEETTGDVVMIQAFQNDYAFLLRLLRQAVSTFGIGGYRLYARNGELHFHTPSYQCEARFLDLFAHSQRIKSFVIDHSQQQSLIGAAGIECTSFDLLTGKTELVSSSPERFLKYSAVAPAYPAAMVKPIKVHLGQNAIEAIAAAQNAYASARQGCFELKFDTDLAMFLNLDDVINCVVTNNPPGVSAWSGKYAVSGFHHVYNRGSIASAFSLQRGEMMAETNPQFNLDPTAIQSGYNAAGGDDLNPASLKASSPGQVSIDVIDGG